MNKEYLAKWLKEHSEELRNSEWYENNSDLLDESDFGNNVDYFIKEYLVPLIESNVSFDFENIEIDAKALFNL